jgi:hypothetical protein
MGELKFRVTPPDLVNRLPGLKRAYVTGLDRTPGRMTVQLKPGLMICRRESPESGRLHVAWPVEGRGTLMLNTATLPDRDEPYDLAVELARGRLNDVRNQLADWQQMGLPTSPEIDQQLQRSKHAFSVAVTSWNQPKRAAKASAASLVSSLNAGDLLIQDYAAWVLKKRLEFQSPLPTAFGTVLSGDMKKTPWTGAIAAAVNMARIHCAWSRIAPTEGKLRWDEPDAQLAWCKSQKIIPTAGPILDLRPGALPDWLWLWQGDFEEIQSMAVDVTRAAVNRYRGKIAAWHLVSRPASGEILGLTEEEQVRLTARILQTARQADPNVQLIVNFDRPWGGWLGSSTFQIGPLHLADSLAKADLGLSGIGLEIAPGFLGAGSVMRSLNDYSRLLDTFALVNLPLHVTLVAPSSDADDPAADANAKLDLSQWPSVPDDALQREFAERWLPLTVAKPFVRSVTWGTFSDSAPHLYPNTGLIRADGSVKPIVEAMAALRSSYLN